MIAKHHTTFYVYASHTKCLTDLTHIMYPFLQGDQRLCPEDPFFPRPALARRNPVSSKVWLSAVD